MTVRQNLHINQKETWTYVHTHRDSAGVAVDLTGYSSRMSIRDGYGSWTALEAYLDTDEARAQSGVITLSADGEITMSMTSTQTNALSEELLFALFEGKPERVSGRFVDYFYDLIITDPDGVVTRVIEGILRIQRGVTI